MSPIKKILVGLDFSEMDPTLIKFAAFVAKDFSATDICFIHVIRGSRIPKEIKLKYPELSKVASAEKKEQMQALVAAHIDPQLTTSFKYVVKRGQAAKKTLKTAREEAVDLVIVGRKSALKGSGVLSQRLARRLECSLLIVSQDCEPKLKSILVPSDLTDYSALAMKEAINVASNSKLGVAVICQNVYTVPTGYYYSGKTYEEFAQLMEKHARADYEKFIRKIDTKGIEIKAVYSLDSDDDPVEDIYQMAKNSEADILIIGAKGRSSTTALFLGSMAERLIQYNFQIPVLIVRHKGRNAGILDYLKEL